VPELPEVETTRRGIAPHVVGQTIASVVIREPRLRWPVPDELRQQLPGQTILAVKRRAKYLLLLTARGTVLLHLGMSGSLRIVPCEAPPAKHDHVDLVLADGNCIRLRDPRRFGALLWTDDPLYHPLLVDLGPEPWDMPIDYLFECARGRRQAVKSFIMDGRVVVGVGNIYANEALFEAGVRPTRAAGKVSRARYERLSVAIAAVLDAAIRHGGTTLRDFVNSEGKPGYFRINLKVYDRAGWPCVICGTEIRCQRVGQRASYYCPRCQR
jgi:formamidopyrimidine-DNA glycosylase